MPVKQWSTDDFCLECCHLKVIHGDGGCSFGSMKPISNTRYGRKKKRECKCMKKFMNGGAV